MLWREHQEKILSSGPHKVERTNFVSIIRRVPQRRCLSTYMLVTFQLSLSWQKMVSLILISTLFSLFFSQYIFVCLGIYILQNIWTLWMWGSPSSGRLCCPSQRSKGIWKPGMPDTVLVSHLSNGFLWIFRLFLDSNRLNYVQFYQYLLPNYLYHLLLKINV